MRHTVPHAYAGRKAQPPGYSFQTENYDQFQVIHVLGGELIFQSGDMQKALGAGHAVILRETSRFKLRCRKKGYHGVYFAAALEPEPLFKGKAECIDAPARMQAVAEIMNTETWSPEIGSRRILLALGRVLAWQAIQLVESTRPLDPPNYARACAERAKQAIDASLYTDQSVHDVLLPLRLSYRQTARYFRQTYGTTPKVYQLRSRIREAERLLQFSDFSITAIALELGFSSSQHFATQFAKIKSVTPTAFRKQD